MTLNTRKVITGSLDWSPFTAQTIDETLLLIHSADTSPEMGRLRDTNELGISPHHLSQLERQRIKCGAGWRGAEQTEKRGEWREE